MHSFQKFIHRELTLKMSNENKIINQFLRPLALNKESQNLKNDAAVLEKVSSNYVISSDMMIENIHFHKGDDPKTLAKKLLRVNMSDLAAMGCIPYGYILNLGLPKSNTNIWLKSFCNGLRIDQKYFNLKLLGGDLSKSKVIFLSVTIIGKKEKCILNCCTAKNGSDIFVSGTLGDAALGLFLKQNPNFSVDDKLKNFFLNKLHNPSPRIELGHSLCGYADSCTDISDGLILDLEKISSLSSLKSTIFLKQIPLSVQAKKMKKIFKNDSFFWEKIITGGEDYELVFSMSKLKQKFFFKKQSKHLKKVKKIGFFEKGNGCRVVKLNNKDFTFKKKIGYSHF